MLHLILAMAILSLNHFLLEQMAEIFILFMFALTFAYGAAMTARTTAGVISRTGLNVGFSRKIALLLIVCTGIGLVYASVYILFPILKHQAIDIVNKIGDDSFRVGVIDNIAKLLSVSKAQPTWFGISYADLHTCITELLGSLNKLANITDLSDVASKTGSVMHISAQVLVTLIMSIHMLKDWGKWNGKIISLLDQLGARQEYRDRVVVFLTNFDTGFKGWLLGQLLISLILSGYYFICFGLLKLKGGLLVALISGFSAFTPYLGDVITVITVGVSVSLTGGISVLQIVFIGAFIVVGHCIGSYILTPMLMKQHTGVSPLQIIIGMLLFKALFGIPGIILNIPILVAINAVFGAVFFKLAEPEEEPKIKEGKLKA